MKARRIFGSMLCALALLIAPVTAVAQDIEDAEDAEGSLGPVIITEVQTGKAARDDEFIELYNTTDDEIDITQWQIRYITANAGSASNVTSPTSTLQLASLSGDGPILIPANDYVVLYAGVVTPETGVLAYKYDTALMPATGGSIVLIGFDAAACEFVVEDAVAWGGTEHLFGEGEALVPGTSNSNDRLYQRFVAEDMYVDVGNNAGDFSSAVATAISATPGTGVDNNQELPGTLPAGSGEQSQTYANRFAKSGCVVPDNPDDEPPAQPPQESPPSQVIEPPASSAGADTKQPSIPAANTGLKAPLLSELLPNPASPQTDKDDEFIELYNANDAYFDLSGYVLEVGLTTTRRYTIPAGTKIAPRTFLAFFSANTNIALSNSGSKVALLDPLGRMLVISDAYGSAKDGQAWVLANGVWQWTTQPTPNATNVVSAPAAKSSAKTTSASSARQSSSGGQAQAADNGENDEDGGVLGTTTGTPLHPGVLAGVAAFALLYGAYEYKNDIKSRIQKFRANRALRRTAGPST